MANGPASMRWTTSIASPMTHTAAQYRRPKPFIRSPTDTPLSSLRFVRCVPVSRTITAEEGQQPVNDPKCERCGDVADYSTPTCCSSHGKVLCHRCYKRTHFVDICNCGRPD